MLADTILKKNAQFTFNVDMLYSNNDFDFEHIIDLIHINKQLKDIRRILDRSISIQDCFKMMSMWLYITFYNLKGKENMGQI